MPIWKILWPLGIFYGLWKNLGFCTFSLENVLFHLDMPNELLTKNVIFPETFFDESLSLEPVPVR
jgi:hypothetical protein